MCLCVCLCVCVVCLSPPPWWAATPIRVLPRTTVLTPPYCRQQLAYAGPAVTFLPTQAAGFCKGSGVSVSQECELGGPQACGSQGT